MRKFRKLLQRMDNPRCKIVSMRLNDEEWEELAEICMNTNKTVSEYLREALTHMEMHSHEQLRLRRTVSA